MMEEQIAQESSNAFENVDFDSSPEKSADKADEKALEQVKMGISKLNYEFDEYVVSTK